MEAHHLNAQLKQLVSRGYSISDIRALIKAPQPLLDKVIADLETENSLNRALLNAQSSQARYAMHLGANR